VLYGQNTKEETVSMAEMSKSIHNISFRGLVIMLCGLAMFAASDAHSAMIVGGSGYRCMDVKGSSATNGTPIQSYDCHGGFNQQWNIINGDIRGIGTLEFAGVTKCLDVAGFSTADGAVVQLWDCTGGSNQKWTFRSGRIVGTASGKCLDLGTGANGPASTEQHQPA
jgi:Ricin-type beta-trefoil lectin domain